MILNIMKVFFILIIISFKYCNCHTYHMGDCEPMQQMQDFNMKQFLGIWYAIQKSDTQSSCLTYNITNGHWPYQYYIEQISQHSINGPNESNLVDYLTSYTGEISSTPMYNKETNVVGENDMIVKFPLNFAGSSSFIVFTTDYVNYAGIYTCQKFIFFHRKSITILSRSKSVEPHILREMYSQLESHNINLFDLNSINHDECLDSSNEEIFLRVDPDVISTVNVFNKVKIAAENAIDIHEKGILNHTLQNIENVLTSIIQPINITISDDINIKNKKNKIDQNIDEQDDISISDETWFYDIN